VSARRAYRASRRVPRALGVAIDTIVRGRLGDRRDPVACADRLRDGFARILAIHSLTVTVRGTWPQRPVIYVANHVSYLDPGAIAACVRCAPIAKGEVASWPLIGTASPGLGVIFVDRSSPHSGARALLRARKVLAAGVSVLNFPEGTTTDGNTLLPFKRGIFGLARITGAPVVPIALRYASDDLAWTGGSHFVPHYLGVTASRRTSAVHVDLGPAISPARFASAEDLASFAHDRIARMLRDLPEIHDPVLRLRVSPPRPDPVLPTPGGDVRVLRRRAGA